MKLTLKHIMILAGAFLLGASLPAQSPGNTFYGVNLQPICWLTPLGVDSTIYVAWLDAAGKTTPSRIHYFNVQGAAVSVPGGTLRPGYCGTAESDTIIVRLDSLLNNTSQPQTCDCIYQLSLDNLAFSVGANDVSPTETHDRVVTRNCGNGAEEILRLPVAVTGGKAYRAYNSTGPTDLDDTGWIDSFRVYTANPSEAFWIYCEPTKVAAAYPALLATLDTADLRFTSATFADFEAAIEAVVAYAIPNWAVTHSPVLSTPTYKFNATINADGDINLKFTVYNEPTGTYVGLNTASGTRRLYFHQNSTTAVNTTGIQKTGITGGATLTYDCPCDTTIVSSYSFPINLSSSDEWAVIELVDPPVATLTGSLGTATCTQTCPTMVDNCLSICDIITVRVAEADSASCPVQGIAEHRSISSSSQSVASNYYHSISIAVTSGTVAITTVNPGNLQTITYSAGQSLHVSAPDPCNLITTGFGVNATSGTALIATIR